MGKVTEKEAHAASVARAIKLYSPYAVVDGELVGCEAGSYAVVFTAPKGGDRKVVATRTVKVNAKILRNLLNEAWAEGHWASAFGRKS
jgi:hypothetical protein